MLPIQQPSGWENHPLISHENACWNVIFIDWFGSNWKLLWACLIYYANSLLPWSPSTKQFHVRYYRVLTETILCAWTAWSWCQYCWAIIQQDYWQWELWVVPFFDLPTCSFNSFFILTFIRCLSSYKDFAFARTQSYWRWRSESKCNWWSLMLWDSAVNDLYR